MNVRIRMWAGFALMLLMLCSDNHDRGAFIRTLPMVQDHNAEIAARDCGVSDWRLVKMFVLDGPPTDVPHFSYEIESLPSERIAVEEGRGWDRTKRIGAINLCLCESLVKQDVQFGIAAPGLVEIVHN